MRQTLSLLRLQNLFLLLLNLSGVQCQSFSPPTEDICLGDSITYTCVVVNSVAVSFTSWTLTPDGGVPSCAVRHNLPDMQTCGPGRVFTSSLTGQSGDNTSFTSTLSVESISESLNGTTVECDDAMMNTVGSMDICIVAGELVPPEFLPASISEPDVGVDECVLSVRWSEPVISCAGSVSRYVLSVTPPTSDCQSGSGDCVFMTNQTQYHLTVNASQTYNLTVIADGSCGNMGQPAKYNVDLTAQARVQGNCSYSYMYDPTTSRIESLKVQWPRFNILGTEADYKVVIIPQSGDDIVCGDNAVCNCTDDNYCSYFFKSISINDSYSAAVKVVGCVTERITCDNVSSRCNITDLQVPLPSNGNWTGLSNEAGFRFEGGNVTYNGISEGSVATYTTFGNFLVNDNQTFNTTCRNDEWDQLPTISILTISTTSVCAEVKLVDWNIALIVIGVIAYITGVCIAVILCTLLFLRAKKPDVIVRMWYKVMLVASVVVAIISSIMWVVLIGYSVSLGDDAECGTSGVRDVLVIVCCVLSLLVVLEWSVCTALWRCAVMDSGIEKQDSFPAATYEEVGVSGEVTSYSTHNIQLSSNEAYAPLHKDNIHTSRNAAYGQVQL